MGNKRCLQIKKKKNFSAPFYGATVDKLNEAAISTKS